MFIQYYLLVYRSIRFLGGGITSPTRHRPPGVKTPLPPADPEGGEKLCGRRYGGIMQRDPGLFHTGMGVWKIDHFQTENAENMQQGSANL